MADLDNKLQAVSIAQNIAKSMSDLADQTNAMQLLIASRGWSTITNEELASKGITAAQFTSFIGLMNQYNRLMSGQAVTTTQGRTIADAVKAI